MTLSTDPHEWCESEDEPDGSQMFLYVEASSCGFVNLAPALALCELEHPRLPATFARMFLNSIGNHFRDYDDRDAEEHISILEDNYEPEADGEERAGLPDRNKILPACMKQKPMGYKGLKAMLSRMAPKSRAARLLRATSNSGGYPTGKTSGDPGACPRTVLRLQSSSSRAAGDLPIGRRHRGVFRRRAPIDDRADTGALAADSVRRDGAGKHAEGIRLFGWRSGYARRRAPRAEFGSGLGSDAETRRRNHDQVSALRFQLKLWAFQGHSGVLGRSAIVRDDARAQGLSRWRSTFLDAGEALTVDFLKQLAKGLGRSVPREILPSNVLARTPDILVWWMRQQRRAMFFNDSGNGRTLNGGLSATRAGVQSMRIRAFGARLAENRRPRPDTPLMFAPYWNCDAEAGCAKAV